MEQAHPQARPSIRACTDSKPNIFARPTHRQQHTRRRTSCLNQEKTDIACIAKQAHNQQANHLAMQSTTQPANQPLSQPANQATNQRTSHSIGACSHSGSQPATQPCNQSLKQTTNHSTIKPTTQPANPAPTRQLITHFRREDAQPTTPGHRSLAV